MSHYSLPLCRPIHHTSETIVWFSHTLTPSITWSVKPPPPLHAPSPFVFVLQSGSTWSITVIRKNNLLKYHWWKVVHQSITSSRPTSSTPLTPTITDSCWLPHTSPPQTRSLILTRVPLDMKMFISPTNWVLCFSDLKVLGVCVCVWCVDAPVSVYWCIMWLLQCVCVLCGCFCVFVYV